MRRAVIAVTLCLIAFATAAVSEAPSSAAVPSSLTGKWTGYVTWPDGNHPTLLDVHSSRPLRGNINVFGKCQGTWREVSRSGDQLRVGFRRTAGTGCTSNEWNISFTGSRNLYGIDTTRSDTRIRLTRDKPQTCGSAYADALNEIPPGASITAELLLRRLTALPKWAGSTVLLASCIGHALDYGDGNTRSLDIWANINSREMYDAVCNLAEAAFDPLGLGYTKNAVCGTPVG